VKRVVAQTSINAAKNKFNTLRKLALVMAKMGSLRDLALQAAEIYRYELGRNWKIDPEIALIADKFNFEEPTFKDVELLFKYGACQCERPNRHHYSNGQWVPLSTDEYAYDYARRAVEYGLRALRKHFHENNDGYHRITT
jgi:hypothetical protein